MLQERSNVDNATTTLNALYSCSFATNFLHVDFSDVHRRDITSKTVVRSYHIHCVSKNVVSNLLQYLQQLLTDFENSFTVENNTKLSVKISYFSPFLKNPVALPCETYKFYNVAIALPIHDDTAVLNCYDDFVNC